MEGRIVTQETVNELENVFFNSDTFFHFVQDINDNWFLFLTEQDEIDIFTTDYAYLLELPLVEFVPKPKPIPFQV
jgi:hypothetical protein